MIGSMFHTEEPKTLGVTLQILAAWEIWCRGFVYPWLGVLSIPNTKRKK
jgi:hypothetical protein